jgi:hypothetical protein
MMLSDSAANFKRRNKEKSGLRASGSVVHVPFPANSISYAAFKSLFELFRRRK